MTVTMSRFEQLAWRAALDKLTPPKPSPYLTDPVGWVQNELGEHLWSKQRQIAESVVTNRRTAVRSCHNAGKSFLASRIAAWWIAVHPPGEAFVASTAPSYPQVHAILWEEIRKAARKSKSVPGRVLQSDEWKLDDGTIAGWGRKPADTDEHGFQGIHRRYVLVILDEACGIPTQLWTAVEAITTNADCRILAIGNPDDPNTEFANVCKPGSGWNVIEIDGLTTPNMTPAAVAPHPELTALFDQLGIEPTVEAVPDGLRPLMLDPEWVVDKIRRWGAESPRFTSKIRGRFPEIGVDTLFPPSMLEAAHARHLEATGQRALGVDVARYGTDRTVIYLRHGPVIRLLGEYSKQPTTETTGRVVAAHRETGADEIRVDGVGVGAGVVDQLTEQGLPVLDMQAGARAEEPDRFVNARAEWAWQLRDAMEAGEVDLDPADDELVAQLGALKYRYDSRGRIVIESKDEMRKRGLPSPDRADAAILTATASSRSDLYPALRWRYWRPAVTGIPGQVDCGGRLSTFTDGWRYVTVYVPDGDEQATTWAVAAAWCQTVGGDLLLLDRVRVRLDDATLADAVAPLVRAHSCDTVFVPHRRLTDALRASASRAKFSVTALTLPADRLSRALPASAAQAAGKVWLPAERPWLAQWVAECRAFPHGRTAGSVEVLAAAVHVQSTRWQPMSQPQPVTPATRDDFDVFGSDVDFATMRM